MILGIGVDIVNIARIKAVIDRYGERFLLRAFCPQEIEDCSKKVESAPCYAARFAAKEAFVKALGTGFSRGIALRQVCIEKLETGAPVINIQGVALEKAKDMGVKKIHVSLSHERDAAIAMVVIERGGH